MLARQVGKPQTLLCEVCERRRPRTGTRLLGERQVRVCPDCFTRFEPYLDTLEEVREELFRQWLRLAARLARSKDPRATPELLQDHLEKRYLETHEPPRRRSEP